MRRRLDFEMGANREPHAEVPKVRAVGGWLAVGFRLVTAGLVKRTENILNAEHIIKGSLGI